MKIILKEIELYGFHGVHKLERLVGVPFIVDIEMEIPSISQRIDLDQTIDYAKAYDILKNEFQIPEMLLENLALRISDSIKSNFPSLLKISIRIFKIGAYIEGLQGKLGIEFEKTFST